MSVHIINIIYIYLHAFCLYSCLNFYILVLFGVYCALMGMKIGFGAKKKENMSVSKLNKEEKSSLE